MDRRTVTLAAGVVALVAVALIGAAVALDRGATGTLAYDEDERSLQQWCDAVVHEVTAGPPTRSFRALADQALAGELVQPDPVDDPADRVALERWQREHAAYLTSSFVRLLEGWPKELALEHEVVVQSLAEAHGGEPVTLADELPRAGAAIDRYVARRC